MKIQLKPTAESGRIIELFSLIDITERRLNDFLLQKYTQEIESLFHLSQKMIQNLNADEIINSIPKHIVQALSNAEAASIWKYNKSEDDFEIVSWYGFEKGEAEDLRLPKSETLIGKIYTRKKGIICNDTFKEPLFKDEENNLPTKSTLGTPIFDGEEVLYIIFADNFYHTNVFNKEDLKILQSFANISGIALNNVKLYNKIKTSELKFRSIVDSVGESIFIHDMETGQIVDVNNKALETFGYTYEESLELTANEASSNVYPYTPEEAFNFIQKAKNEGPQLFEWHAKKKNGELFWTEINLRKIKIGNEDRIVAVVRDITERKRNEQQIYYQANLLDSANDAIIASSDKMIGKYLNNKITFWNKGAEKLFGWKKEEAIGKNIRDLISLEIMNSTFENLVQGLIKKGFWSGDTIQYDKKGNKKYIHLSVSAIKENGKIIGSIGVNHDITDKIIAEQAIKENEAKINSIMRGAPVGIGFARNRILEYVNNHLLKMLGYSRKEMIGKNSKMFYESFSEYDKIGELYNKLKNKVVTFSEARIAKKSGEIIDVIITLSPLEKNDLSKGLVFSVLDITEKKKAEIRRKELEVSYQDIFDNTSDAIYIQDSNGKFLDVNKGVVEMYGYPKETFIGNTPEFLSAEGKNDLE